MSQQPVTPVRVIAGLAIASLIALGCASVPVEASAERAPGAHDRVRETKKCAELKTRKARKKCRKNQQAQSPTVPTVPTPSMPTSTPSVSVQTSATAVPTARPSVTAPSVPLLETPQPEAVVPMKPFGAMFGAASEWHRDIAYAPVAQNSAALVSNLSRQVTDHYNGVAAFNVWDYNVSTYTVPATQPRVRVIWDDCQGKGYVPSQLYTASGGAHFASVPVPDDAVPATGTDGELSIYSPATDQLWEFWVAHKEADGWHACWGGRIDRVSQSKGFFGQGMGVAATGLSMTAGAIGIEEARALSINHAMSLNVIDAAHFSQFSYPAQRSDGGLPLGTPNAIQEGQRFRLDPSIDVSTLNLTPLGRAIARAAQRYGFIINDKGGAVAVITESGAGMVKAGRGNPWNTILNGTPAYNVMRNFPWDRMQALPLNYGQ